MAAELCPRCGKGRTGSFRFCRSCQFDFDTADSASGRPGAVSTPAAAVPVPVVARTVAEAAVTIPAAAVPVPVVARTVSREPKPRRGSAQKALMGLIAVAIIGGAALLLNPGKAPSLGVTTNAVSTERPARTSSPGVPLNRQVDPAGLPPAGTIWFGSGFDPDTFAISSRLTSVTTNQPFSFVAHLTRSLDASAMGIRISWNGQDVPANAANARGTGDVWGFTPGPLYSAGAWKYELTDIGGNIVASGTITAKWPT